MNLFIQVEDGQTVNHPAVEENLIQAFGSVPLNWEPFIRVKRPSPGVYEILELETPNYEKIDGVWTDVWPLRAMTQEEIAAKQQSVRDEWAARRQAENWSAWTLDETTCTMVPPIPRPEPTSGVNTFWCGAENNWKQAPLMPDDGKQYQFDFFGWQWEEIPSV